MKVGKVIYYILIGLITSCSQSNENTGEIRLGNFNNRPRGFQSMYMPQGQIALFIENTSGKEAIIQHARFFVGDKGNWDKPFGVKFYSVDTVTGRPDCKLLSESIIVKATNGNVWHSVDVSKYNIPLAVSGIFVAMEWIPDNDFNTASQTECQYLAYSKMKNKNNTWYCTLGINWYQLPDCDYNTMISIDVK